MKRLLIGIGLAVILAGCGTGGKKPAAVEQKDVFAQQQSAQDEAARQRAAEEEARKRAEAERRAREAAEQPVVQPLPGSSVSQGELGDPASQLKDPNSPLSKRSVYYGFDMYNVADEYQSMIEAHARLLRENKNLRVRVEGNCDDRGSREYNLALGQRRADAVRRALTLLGVAERQIESVSFGAEKPKMQGSNEEAWAENRRSDLVYVGIDG
ncbi:MAG: peptidoglycan-associated lipoprotein Pal [Burkholderiales bacterium]|nr:peptidoglycan-associated lipoprotein Pal [Burkholderiales bacterium]